jgi:hypothetical protein
MAQDENKNARREPGIFVLVVPWSRGRGAQARAFAHPTNRARYADFLAV